MGPVAAEFGGLAMRPPGRLWTGAPSATAVGGAALVIKVARSLRRGSTMVLGISKVIPANAFSLASLSVRVFKRSVKALSLVLASSGFSSSSFLHD